MMIIEKIIIIKIRKDYGYENNKIGRGFKKEYFR